MTRIRKYIIGSGIIALLIIAVILYSNYQNNINTEYKNVDQIEASRNQSEVNNDTIQDADDIAVQATPFVKKDNNINNVPKISQDVVKQEDISGINELILKYYDVTNKFDPKIFFVNKQEDLDQRKELFLRKKEIVQKYESIKNYIKPGLSEDTYIVYSTYDIKIKNIDVMVPGMSVLTVVKDRTSGEFFVNESPNNKELNDYINEVSKSDDMNKIIEEVNRELTITIKNDASLKEFVEYLKEIT